MAFSFLDLKGQLKVIFLSLALAGGAGAAAGGLAGCDGCPADSDSGVEDSGSVYPIGVPIAPPDSGLLDSGLLDSGGPIPVAVWDAGASDSGGIMPVDIPIANWDGGPMPVSTPASCPRPLPEARLGLERDTGFVVPLGDKDKKIA